MPEVPDDDFVYIDRCALIVRPTWKFAEWVNSLDGGNFEETDVMIQTVYLVEFEESLDAAATADLLDYYYLDIAASEFGAWWTDEADWPPLRSLNDFFQYFECHPSETVIDLAADPAEELDELEED
jgi:hypothetical protein